MKERNHEGEHGRGPSVRIGQSARSKRSLGSRSEGREQGRRGSATGARGQRAGARAAGVLGGRGKAAAPHRESAPHRRPHRPSAARRSAPAPTRSGRVRARTAGEDRAQEAASYWARGKKTGGRGIGSRGREGVRDSPLAWFGLLYRPADRGARGLAGRRRPRPGQHHPAAGPSHRHRSHRNRHRGGAGSSPPADNRAKAASEHAQSPSSAAGPAALPASHRSPARGPAPPSLPSPPSRPCPPLSKLGPAPPGLRPAPRSPRAPAEISRALSALFGPRLPSSRENGKFASINSAKRPEGLGSECVEPDRVPLQAQEPGKKC